MNYTEKTGLKRIGGMLRNRGARFVPVKPRRISLSAPLASFTFDDFAKSAWREGGKLMESYGARATYYTSGGLCGTMHDHVRCYDEDDLSALAAAGHDVGCHTFEHVAIQGLDRSKIETTLRR